MKMHQRSVSGEHAARTAVRRALAAVKPLPLLGSTWVGTETAALQVRGDAVAGELLSLAGVLPVEVHGELESRNRLPTPLVQLSAEWAAWCDALALEKDSLALADGWIADSWNDLRAITLSALLTICEHLPGALAERERIRVLACTSSLLADIACANAETLRARVASVLEGAPAHERLTRVCHAIRSGVEAGAVRQLRPSNWALLSQSLQRGEACDRDRASSELDRLRVSRQLDAIVRIVAADEQRGRSTAALEPTGTA